MKVIDTINERMHKRQIYYSFEFFPPKTAAGLQNLYTRVERMAQLQPLFCDITWGAGGSGSDQALTLEISAAVQKLTHVNILMHLTCANLTIDDALSTLQAAKAAGICNLLILRGDPVRGTVDFKDCDKGFSHAIDLVRFIRERFGNDICIGVAGYPEGHVESLDANQDLMYLKEKVDAGADFVITQLFYNTEVYAEFVGKCRRIGIHCPIIPGIMPVQSYSGFIRMTSFCNTHVPQEIWDALAPIKEDDEAIKRYGVELGIRMCQTLLNSGAPGLHFYTLNLESSVRLILHGLGIVPSIQNGSRELPWKQGTSPNRLGESVRPIYWSNRPESYIERTATWDDYPNGRWGSSESPAFGDLSDSHFVCNTISIQERREMWGKAPTTALDIRKVFVSYIRNEIKILPWCDISLHCETKSIQDKLIRINEAGFLTINSQPRVNAEKSEDPVYGWGGKGGRVYQKAYIECFVAPKELKLILENAKRKEIQYYAIDAKGHSYYNVEYPTNAVTWGVFKDKEIIQPTIVDRNSFCVWKEEAFKLWLTMWASIYEEESGAYNLIQEIHDTYFLVSIVDNDFISGDIWSVFDNAA